MSAAVILPPRFQIGARTIASVSRRLVRVPLSLDDVLAGRVPDLTMVGADAGAGADGLLVTSLPAGRLAETATGSWLVQVRQRYARHHVDLSLGVEGWLAALSPGTRSALKRKARKLAAASGGTLDVRSYATADEIAAFHPVARQVSRLTYQERLLGAGLPADAEALVRLAAAGRVRAWLLYLGGEAIAYLCCTADGATLRYDHVGHDPARADLSPGAVLQGEALRDLLTERRFARFDFTEGEGQHKRTLATGSTECVDLLLLRPTAGNRAVLAALAGFDAAVALAKRESGHPLLARIARRVRR